MASGTEMLDDKAEQVLTDATTLKSWQKCEDHYFSIGVIPKAVANDRLEFGVDKARKRARAHIACPRLRSDSHSREPLDRNRILAGLTAQHQASRNVVGNRKAAVHVELTINPYEAQRGCEKTIGKSIGGNFPGQFSQAS